MKYVYKISCNGVIYYYINNFYFWFVLGVDSEVSILFNIVLI